MSKKDFQSLASCFIIYLLHGDNSIVTLKKTLDIIEETCNFKKLEKDVEREHLTKLGLDPDDEELALIDAVEAAFKSHRGTYQKEEYAIQQELEFWLEYKDKLRR
jgi:hypothetical protein